MLRVSAPGLAPSTEITRQFQQPTTKLSPRKFRLVAPVLWHKPTAAIADIEGCTIRTAERILAGASEISGRLLNAACAEMLKPID